MSPWLLAARPKTLVAGLIPVLVGSAAAHRIGGAKLSVFFAALGGALLIQIGTNFVNDASDFLRGADNEKRVGPKRAAQLGLISPQQLYFAAGLCFLLAALAGSYLISLAGISILYIGVASILAAIAYTAGPFPLAYLGLGDVFVLIFFGFVAVCGTVIAHGQPLTWEAYYLGLVVGLHAMALIAVNNIRDIATDVLAGKRTLAVRMGEKYSKIYIAALLLAPYFLIIKIFLSPELWAALPFLSLPLALLAAMKVFRASQPIEYMNALPLVALVQLTFGCLLSLALHFAPGQM